MGSLRTVRERLVPAVLTAAGVTLLAAGLLQYGSGAQAGRGDAGASPAAVLPSPSYAVPSLPPLDGSPIPSASAIPASHRVATRVVVDALGIDLPVIAQPKAYPSCNVAMWLEHPGILQPGNGRSVYLYAHARTGMFLPLLTQSKRNGGKAMIGMLVDVYTSDNQRYVYSITRVLPRVPADSHFLDRALAVKIETLWLQTSTGPGASFPKLQVMAEPVAVVPADPAEAHPKARPVDC
ncbi:MAG TPA: hypothetical protein VFK35_00545 [Candidatus Limnocylindrales bacterium]|nr:hypothetical protein [Candidatus Limnocylindrales bacterium]